MFTNYICENSEVIVIKDYIIIIIYVRFFYPRIVLVRAAPTKIVMEYAHTPDGLADATPLDLPGEVSFDECVPGGVDDGDGLPILADEAEGVAAAGNEPAGDVVGELVDTGELAGVGAGGEVAVDSGELAGVEAGGEVVVDTGELAEGEGEDEGDVELFDGYGDSGDGVIPFPEGVCATPGGRDDDGEEVLGA